MAQHKVLITLPGYLTFFNTIIQALPTGIAYMEPLNSYLGSVQHFRVQAPPSAPLHLEQQTCSTCTSSYCRELLLCNPLGKHPQLCLIDPCCDTQLKWTGFLISPLLLCYDQFLVAFNLFLASVNLFCRKYTKIGNT